MDFDCAFKKHNPLISLPGFSQQSLNFWFVFFYSKKELFLKSAAMGWVFLKTPATGATVKIPPWTVLVWYLLIWLSKEGDPNLLSYSRITGLCVCMCLCVCVCDRERGEISLIHVCPLMDLFVFLSRLFPAPPPWSVCRDMGYDLEVSESTLPTNKESWYFLGVCVCVCCPQRWR